MECPTCGKLMEKGYIVSRGGMYWNTKVPKTFPRGEPLTTPPGELGGFRLEAYRCKSCKIIKYKL